MPGRMNIEKYKRSNTNLTLSAPVECRNAISWMSTIKGTRLALTPWPLQFSFQNPVTLSSLSTKTLLWGWPREVRTLKGLSKGVCLYCHHHPAPLCDKFFIIQLSSCTTPAPSCNCTTFTLFVRHSKPPLSSKNCKTGMTDKPQILRRSPDCRSKFADVSLFPFQADPIHWC